MHNKFFEDKEEFKWEVSFVLWMFFAASIWVVIKYLNDYFWVFQQIFFRSTIAFVMSVMIYYLFFWKLNFSKISKKDYGILALRWFMHVAAFFFWVTAVTTTTLANATLVAAIPAQQLLEFCSFQRQQVRKMLLT